LDRKKENRYKDPIFSQPVQAEFPYDISPVIWIRDVQDVQVHEVIHQLRTVIQKLPSGSFSFVMATGIVSTAFHLIGREAISLGLLVVAISGLVVLTIAIVWRVIMFRANLLLDVGEPGRAFGFFTMVAAINVVGIRLYQPETPRVTIVLAVISLPIWLLLTYGVPGTLMLQPRVSPVLAEVNGSWFLWVVATQSLSAAAAVIGHDRQNSFLAAAAVALWGIGVMLYLILATLITLRLLTSANHSRTLNPSYWIYMGATAITVLAGSRILSLQKDLPIMIATSTFVSGFTYILWAFGTWWIPLLVVFGVWRHISQHEPARYETGLWSIVFPLGMYSTASMLYGREMHLPLLVNVGQIGTWIAGLVWLTVVVAMVATADKWRRLILESQGLKN
jgi:tellurite resistance protein TehA-like permease